MRASWTVVLYANKDKQEVITIMRMNTMREVAYVLGMPSQHVSNYYHGLVKAHDILHCIDII